MPERAVEQDVIYVPQDPDQYGKHIILVRRSVVVSESIGIKVSTLYEFESLDQYQMSTSFFGDNRV